MALQLIPFRGVLLILGVLVTHITAFYFPPHPGPYSDSIYERLYSDDFDWTHITPEPELVYHDCYQGFQCARLLVPLDWQNHSNPARVALAVIRLPARVPEDDPSHGGSIILNPGGPGGSGVLFALLAGNLIQSRLDSEKHFEIVGFDPRGTSFSTPGLKCFSNWIDELNWIMDKRVVGNLGNGPRAIAFHWATEAARAKLCAAVDESTGANIRSHVSTVSVARDMLHLTEKIDELKYSRLNLIKARNNQAPLLFKSGESKLQYLGVSYGTFLGNVFASMYPDRVKRMILDSVLDAHDWSHDLHHFLQDTEKVLDYFFEQCWRAGSRCVLYRPHDSGPASVKSRAVDAMEKLKKNPISSSRDGFVQVNTYDDLLWVMFACLYQPLTTFDLLAQVFNDYVLEGRPFQTRGSPCVTCAFLDMEVIASSDPITAIQCTDGTDYSNRTTADFDSYLDKLLNQSRLFGPIEAEIKMPCWTWPFKSKWRFNGPFNSSVPILFANNRLDPVTPLDNARKMAQQHKGSAVLELETGGHGALFQASGCMWKHASLYINTGELPAEGTRCLPDCEAFDPGCTMAQGSDDLSSWMLMMNPSLRPLMNLLQQNKQ